MEQSPSWEAYIHAYIHTYIHTQTHTYMISPCSSVRFNNAIFSHTVQKFLFNLCNLKALFSLHKKQHSLIPCHFLPRSLNHAVQDPNVKHSQFAKPNLFIPPQYSTILCCLCCVHWHEVGPTRVDCWSPSVGQSSSTEKDNKKSHTIYIYIWTFSKITVYVWYAIAQSL